MDQARTEPWKAKTMIRCSSRRWVTRCACCFMLLVSGCNVRQYAVSQLAEAVARGQGTFASDDDPELVRDALPFTLKLTESLLSQRPRDKGLLSTACSGFTQYAYAFVQQDADEIEAKDLAAAKVLRDRARKLYLRARVYGLRGLDVAHTGISGQLRQNAREALRRARKEDVGLLYWTAAAWGSAIAISKNNPDLIADQPIVEAMIDRALELDEGFEGGIIPCFLITYEMARPGSKAAALRAGQHFQRAMQLSAGQLAAPLLAMAESVSVQQQNRREFEGLLKRALAIDVDARPQWRMTNLVSQRRARWLLSRTDELFVE